MTSLYVGNIIGRDLIDRDMPVESNPRPLLLGDEGVIVQYGDRETGVTVSVVADSDADAERQVIATFGDDAFIDELTLAAPLPDAIVQGFRNLAHAGKPCSDPDCEVHHPDVIEDPSEMLTALSWFEAGRRSREEARHDRNDDEYESVACASSSETHIHVVGARLTLCGLTPQERLDDVPITAATCAVCKTSNAYQEATR